MSTASRPGGNILAKSMGFSLAMILLFTLVANLLPQVEGEAPVEKEVDLGALTVESFAALGESIFSGKGTCTLCHNDMGRAPDILALNMVEIANEHLKSARYQGKATDAASYFHESMVDPGIFVVKGFGKKGSNDTISPMPAVNKAPIELSDIEMDAIIAFLQAKDGNEVTVSLPTEAPVEEPESTEPAGPAGTVEEIVAKYGCQACHVVLGSGGELGPNLDALIRQRSVAQVRQSIIDPNAVIAEGFPPGVMPQNFADQMMVKELDILVAYLVNGKGIDEEQGSGDKTVSSDSGSMDMSGNALTAEAIIQQFGCQGCHSILGAGGKIGPDLDSVGARLDAAQIRQSIVEPNAVIAKGFPSGVMPPNLVEHMTEVQLNTLVSFLAGRQ